MRLGIAKRARKNTEQKTSPTLDAPEPQSPEPQPEAPPETGAGAEKRRAKRQPIIGLNLLAPRTRLILDAERKDLQTCRIRDVSDTGYRIAVTRDRDIPVGAEIKLEHTDGWSRPVRVCWAQGREFGLEIIGRNTYVILDPAGNDVHECEILAVTETGYRITVANAPKISGNFLLELANGSRRKVRVRWSYRDEFGLELVDPDLRPGFLA